jgi:hypothetical protein
MQFNLVAQFLWHHSFVAGSVQWFVLNLVYLYLVYLYLVYLVAPFSSFRDCVLFDCLLFFN